MDKLETDKKPNKKRIPKLTPKQKGFVKDYVEVKNGAEAVRRNYKLGNLGGSNTPQKALQTASAIATENLNKPAIVQALEKQGITRDFIAEELKDNLRLSKDQQLSTHLKGIELASKLTGDLQNKEIPEGNGVIMGYITLLDAKNKNIIEADYEELPKDPTISQEDTPNKG